MYGSDADGNRGISRSFIDDVDICYVSDEDGNILRKYPQGLKEAVEEAAGGYI